MADPEDLKYTAEHEWVSEPGTSGVMRIGITDYAQEQLGDIVYVHLPEVGRDGRGRRADGGAGVDQERQRPVRPVSGTVVARNEALDANPELCNTDPYGEGWIVEIGRATRPQLDGLLSAAGLRSHGNLKLEVETFRL